MNLHPDSVLALTFCRAIERLLLVRPDRPRSEETRRFFQRIQIAIIRWEQAIHEQDRHHQDSILDHINRDEDLVLEQESQPYEVDHHALIYWHWSLEDTDSEIMWIEYLPTHGLLNKIYISIDNFLYTASAEAVISEEHATTQATIDTRSEIFLMALEISIIQWNHASRRQDTEPPRNTQMIWRKLSRVSLTAEYPDNQLACPICQTAFETGCMFAELVCRHRYHTDCILEWLIHRAVCPMCNSEV